MQGDHREYLTEQ